MTARPKPVTEFPGLPVNPESEEFARLLADAEGGQAEAWNRIYALLYDDLHRIARSQIRRQSDPRLSPTSLISETWLKLSGAGLNVVSRRHLTALIARAMRFVLIDETRRSLSEAQQRKEGLSLSDGLPDTAAHAPLEQLLSLHQALDALAEIDRRLAGVVELRYFGGLSEREVAEVLGVTERTISRDWRKARAYLVTRLGHEGGAAGI
ncbi:MAG: ECF-type sigma factor [Chiayiivirga sp.]|jgi:RNA polymerase sigma factor (TIGR02999 family)|uniref:ECF-type sigma factor n=1 Tax=Chiayiivirga sp. TaxID=2041042 RepID=UPI0025BC849A|nr:ECF-type sigma factor [Chiayiivirga sp.]MCI1709601.1 ECF-type sigma factor [Chiayiivirga sp.]MCI1730112.1 ECF-type sigma factor [Chiayiivirga sp.]